jgi:hypothetical protein
MATCTDLERELLNKVLANADPATVADLCSKVAEEQEPDCVLEGAALLRAWRDAEKAYGAFVNQLSGRLDMTAERFNQLTVAIDAKAKESV